MPKKVANSAANTKDNPNCVGDNQSPEFSWSNVPAGTKSFVLLMTDPEGRGGAGVVHWVAYGIPSSVMGFAEGEVSKLSDRYVGGKSTGAWASIPDHVRRQIRCHIITRSSLSPRTLIQRNYRLD